ncbi:MAG: DUF4157 domain-containing protein [Myxococcales bacterium]|nr:DUF4157 domain-containing protein [Myxococcales bacterium]
MKQQQKSGQRGGQSSAQSKPAAQQGGDARDALRGMSYNQGAAAVAPPQGGHGRLVPQVAAQGVRGGGSALPHLATIQNAFGHHDVSGAQAHVGGAGGAAAEEMGAEAYAMGNDVAFAQQPDLHTAAHEATHLVQQRAGLMPEGGVGSDGDTFEKQADEVASLVTSGQSAEGKLDQISGGGNGSGGAAVQKKSAVQFKKTKGKPISSLTNATVDEMIKGLSPTAGWRELIELWAMVTDGGATPITPNDRDDIVLEMLILVEGAYTFTGDASIDALWMDDALLGRMIGSIEKAASPSQDDTPVEPVEQVVLPNPGTFGILTADAELIGEAGAKFTVSEGEAVEALRGQDGQLVVEVLTRPKGKVGAVDPKLFKMQPRLSNDDDGGLEDYSFKKYEGELFLARDDVAAASVMDVDQGALGDCYLIAAMGAVAASNPDIIKNMIDYDASTGTYKVTFQQMSRGGSFKPVEVEVDAYMPTRRGGSRMAYAMSDSSFNPNNQALWPAVIEKAYAQWKGGYEEIGGGGVSSQAMEELTGVRSTRSAMPRESDVVARFEQFQAENKAVVCGTKDQIDQRSIEGVFSGSGGSYSGKLKDKEGGSAEVKKNTVRIRDKGGNSSSVRDDGKGELVGAQVDDGSVAYSGGAVQIDYQADKGPATAEDLVATYQFEGTLSSSLNVHGNHAYVFREVKDGLIYLQNPWGPAARKHPKGLTGAQFRDLFESIGINAAIPQQDD